VISHHIKGVTVNLTRNRLRSIIKEELVRLIVEQEEYGESLLDDEYPTSDAPWIPQGSPVTDTQVTADVPKGWLEMIADKVDDVIGLDKVDAFMDFRNEFLPAIYLRAEHANMDLWEMYPALIQILRDLYDTGAFESAIETGGAQGYGKAVDLVIDRLKNVQPDWGHLPSEH